MQEKTQPVKFKRLDRRAQLRYFRVADSWFSLCAGTPHLNLLITSKSPSLFHTAVLRIPSINALEGDLKESDFQKLIGRNPTHDMKAFSADVVANVMDKLHLGSVRKTIETVVDKAERNKVFREGSYGAQLTNGGLRN